MRLQLLMRTFAMSRFDRLGCTLVLIGAAGGACAQTYPHKPVRVIIPFAAGGGADGIARVIAPRLSETLGQSFVLDNRPGAGGTLGAGMVAKAEPDGYTLLLSATTLADIDEFDRVQLAAVVSVCRQSRTLSDAGRHLFAASRSKRGTTNDADRLRKYLARFGLDWPTLQAMGA